jgi:hypothetical protein
MHRAALRTFLPEFVQNFVDTRSRFGLPAALASTADRAASKIIGLCVSHVLCFDLDQMPHRVSPDDNRKYRFLTGAEIRRFAQDPSNELDTTFADRADAGHDVCFGVLDHDRLAGYGWCALGSIEPEHTGGIALSFPIHVGYMYKGFTHPEFRGMGLNNVRLALSAPALARIGIRHLVCLVDWTNWASLRSCRRSGCRDLGLAITFQFARRRFWLVPDAARQLGIRFGDDAQLRNGPLQQPRCAAAVA